MQQASQQHPKLASTAFLMADPARAAMLMTLLDGRALPAGELVKQTIDSRHTLSSTGHPRAQFQQNAHHQLSGPAVNLFSIWQHTPALQPQTRSKCATEKQKRPTQGRFANKLLLPLSDCCRQGALLVMRSRFFRLVQCIVQLRQTQM